MLFPRHNSPAFSTRMLRRPVLAVVVALLFVVLGVVFPALHQHNAQRSVRISTDAKALANTPHAALTVQDTACPVCDWLTGGTPAAFVSPPAVTVVVLLPVCAAISARDGASLCFRATPRRSPRAPPVSFV